MEREIRRVEGGRDRGKERGVRRMEGGREGEKERGGTEGKGGTEGGGGEGGERNKKPWSCPAVLKPQSPLPSDMPLPTRPYLLTILLTVLQLGAKYSNI